MMLARRSSGLLPLAFTLIACADPGGGAGEEDVLPSTFADAKSDRAREPVVHGAISADEGHVFATISESERYHAWTLTLGGEARVTLDTNLGGFGEEVDTVLYLYEVGRDGYVARNDNASSRVTYSQVAEDLAAGEYLVVVKGKYVSTRGDFILSASCEGDGCAATDVAEERVEWIDEIQLSYETDGGSAFDEVDPSALPGGARDDYDALDEAHRDDDFVLVAYAWDLHGGGRAWLLELGGESTLEVWIYDEEGALVASGTATESDLIRWD